MPQHILRIGRTYLCSSWRRNSSSRLRALRCSCTVAETRLTLRFQTGSKSIKPPDNHEANNSPAAPDIRGAGPCRAITCSALGAQKNLAFGYQRCFGSQNKECLSAAGFRTTAVRKTTLTIGGNNLSLEKCLSVYYAATGQLCTRTKARCSLM